ncbi:hypothetical protein Tco_1452761 [Tanacetum coccineum]
MSHSSSTRTIYTIGWNDRATSPLRQPTYDAEEDPNKHCDSELQRDVDDTAATLKPEELEPVEQEEPEREVSSRTNIAKIARKWSKPDKHGHMNG